MSAPAVNIREYWLENLEIQLAPEFDPSKPMESLVGASFVIGSQPEHDQVFLVLRQAEAPTAYKAVLVWRRRPGMDRGNLEGPGNDSIH